MKTATINAFYPHLVDAHKAKSLSDVALGDDKVETRIFGGHIRSCRHRDIWALRLIMIASMSNVI